jgi:pyruvate,orthophosphate dikinase
MAKYVYTFGGGKAEGDKGMKEILGGKGANLAEMAKIGLPVPPGLTISTEMCTVYFKNKGQYAPEVKKDVENALKESEKIVGLKFGDPQNPLLVSVRSGARQSMPGMMETILNVGLTTNTIPGMIAKTKNERFVYDSYRRLIMMYSDVVMEKAAGIEPAEGNGIRVQLEHLMDALKKTKGYKGDTDMKVEDLKKLCDEFKAKVQQVLGKPFPDDHMEQLWGSINAVFQSWTGKRAVEYRRIEKIPDEWGTAVTVMAMVFGNMGDNSGTGVAFTRNPATGDNKFYGEWLPNAQGEDVVAGTRTPFSVNEDSKNEANRNFPSLEKAMPETYKQLVEIRNKLEQHYKDMQDIEFTIQDGKLYMLQTRSGKRNGPSAVKMAFDMVQEKLIDEKTAVMRVTPNQLDELLHPMVDPKAELSYKAIATGLPAGPGGAVGKVVLSADKAKQITDEAKKKVEQLKQEMQKQDAETAKKTAEEIKNISKEGRVILVRSETSAEDVQGMFVAEGILTAKGGFTSHASLVARGWGKTCIVGCGALDINLHAGTISMFNTVIKEGDIITLNGSNGKVYAGALPLIVIDLEQNKEYKTFLTWCDKIRKLGVRTNTDTPSGAKEGRKFGAEGIGLTRTERMFYGPEAQRIVAMRKFLMAETLEEREKAIAELLQFQKDDFKGLFRAMEGLPVLIRLLDPPLHEFLPSEVDKDKVFDIMAKDTGKSKETIIKRVEQLKELNPMIGHRGCRVGITFPEITRMQSRAILEALAELTKEGVKAYSEIMYPLIGNVKELIHQKKITLEVAEEVKKKYNIPELTFSLGTMIEVPRGAITADEIAKEAEFFSFGTNDLTQMGCGFSRDDSGTFLPDYVKLNIYKEDPFASLDQEGVGLLVQIAVEKGRKTRPGMKIGICGEHGGDPDSITFFHKTGLTYVSCSPFRVPIARLAAAQAQINFPRQ